MTQIVDRELARFGAYKEELWPAKTSHKDLCNVEITVHMAEALESFLSRTITSKREIINRVIPRSPFVCSKARTLANSPQDSYHPSYHGSLSTLAPPMKVVGFVNLL